MISVSDEASTLRMLRALALRTGAALRRVACQRPEEEGRQLEKPLAGPRATALRVTWLYVAPDPSSQKIDKVQIGREMVVAEKSGPWMRVYANTDIRGTAG